MVKKGVILTRDYSDYYCKMPLYSMYHFGFIFIVLKIQLSSLLPQEQVQWSHRLLAGYLQCQVRLMYCMELLYCIWKGFEAIVIFGAILIASFSLDAFSLYHEIGHLLTS